MVVPAVGNASSYGIVGLTYCGASYRERQKDRDAARWPHILDQLRLAVCDLPVILRDCSKHTAARIVGRAGVGRDGAADIISLQR